MAVIKLEKFGAEIPTLDPHILPANAAQVARNVSLKHGRLQPLRHGEKITSVSASTRSFYRYSNGDWFTWPEVVDATPAPQPNDDWDRVYFTGRDKPRFTTNTLAGGTAPYPTASYTIGVPRPPDPPSVTVQGDKPEGDDEGAGQPPDTRFYIYTYVDEFGEEGPPSDPSNKAEVYYGQTVKVTHIQPPTYAAAAIQSVRIYRSATGSGESGYLFVKDVAFGTSSTTDELDDDELGEVLSTAAYVAPNDDMVGLTVMSNGFLVGFFDNNLCASEIGAPYAWPVAYRLSTEYPIKGLAAFGTSLLVATEGVPYIASGVDPQSLGLERTDIHQPCVSGRGVVSVPGGGAYPSADGLVVVTTSGASIITEAVMSADEWRKLAPESIHAVIWEQLYLGFYDNGSEKGSFAISLSGPNGIQFFDYYADFAWNDYQSGHVFVLKNNEVQRWNTGDDLSYTWRSKKLRGPTPIHMTVARVLADHYDHGVDFKLIGDGQTIMAKTVTSDAVFRLPAVRAHEFEIELIGKDPVYSVSVANTLSELGIVPQE